MSRSPRPADGPAGAPAATASCCSRRPDDRRPGPARLDQRGSRPGLPGLFLLIAFGGALLLWMAAQVAITGLILTPMQLDFVVLSIVLLLESVQARRSAARGNHRAPQEVP